MASMGVSIPCHKGPHVAAKGLELWWFQVGECVGTFWRPNFDVNLYPYLPAHITKPKEVKRLYIIPLPERCYFAVWLHSTVLNAKYSIVAPIALVFNLSSVSAHLDDVTILRY